jgi:hypothetical protein
MLPPPQAEKTDTAAIAVTNAKVLMATIVANQNRSENMVKVLG